MNTISQIDVFYLRPSRTIETLFLDKTKEVVYLYNYEGNHFRLFTRLIDLIHFFQFGTEPEISFSNETEFDDYLLKK